MSENCSDIEIKEKFLQLAKEYHPDSGTEKSNAQTFSEMEQAYRFLQVKLIDWDIKKWTDNIFEIFSFKEKRKEESGSDVMEEEEDILDIRHTTPQHRQYLSYEVSFYHSK